MGMIKKHWKEFIVGALGLISIAALALHFVPSNTFGYAYTYWFPSNSDLFTTIPDITVKLRDNQILRAGDDDDSRGNGPAPYVDPPL